MKFFKLEDGRYVGLEDNLPQHLIDLMPELIENGLIDTSYDTTYNEDEFQHITNPAKPSFKNTLTCAFMNETASNATELAKVANDLGYSYFTFNEQVYKITARHNKLNWSAVEGCWEMHLK